MYIHIHTYIFQTLFCLSICLSIYLVLSWWISKVGTPLISQTKRIGSHRSDWSTGRGCALRRVVGRITTPQKVHTLVPKTRACVALHGKMDFADWLSLQILGWEDNPGLSGGPTLVTWVCKSGGQFLAVIRVWRQHGKDLASCRWDRDVSGSVSMNQRGASRS